MGDWADITSVCPNGKRCLLFLIYWQTKSVNWTLFPELFSTIFWGGRSEDSHLSDATYSYKEKIHSSYDELSKCFDPVTLPSGVEPAPVEVLQLIQVVCSSDKPCQSARCSCYSAHVKCSVFCVCHGLCSNNNIEDDNNDYDINHNLNV